MEQYWNSLVRVGHPPERDEDKLRLLDWYNYYEKEGHVFDDWYDRHYWGRDPDFDQDNDECDVSVDVHYDPDFYDHAIPTNMREGGGYYDNFGNELIEDDWKDEIEREDDWFDDFTQEEGCPHPLLYITGKELIALMKRDESSPLQKIEDLTQGTDQNLPRLVAPKAFKQPNSKSCPAKEKQLHSMEYVHPNEYKKVIQNSTKIVIQSIENVNNAIRTLKNHSLLCNDCGASDGHYSIFIEQEVENLLHQVGQLRNLVKKT